MHGEDGWHSMRDVDVRAANSFRLSLFPFISILSFSSFHFHPFIFILSRPSFPRTFPVFPIYAQYMLNICSIYAQYMLMLTTAHFYREYYPRKGVDFLCLASPAGRLSLCSSRRILSDKQRRHFLPPPYACFFQQYRRLIYPSILAEG